MLSPETEVAPVSTNFGIDSAFLQRMECGYGCLSNFDLPPPESRSGRNKLTVPLKVLCELGGWKTAQTVLQCYQRADEEQLRNALEQRRRVRS